MQDGQYVKKETIFLSEFGGVWLYKAFCYSSIWRQHACLMPGRNVILDDFTGITECNACCLQMLAKSLKYTRLDYEHNLFGILSSPCIFCELYHCPKYVLLKIYVRYTALIPLCAWVGDLRSCFRITPHRGIADCPVFGTRCAFLLASIPPRVSEYVCFWCSLNQFFLHFGTSSAF